MTSILYIGSFALSLDRDARSRETIRMRTILHFLLALLVATLPQSAIAADTVFIMRHLQKAEGADPPLSAEGSAGAKELVGMLAKTGITAIFATPTRRAMETAQPLAAKLGIAIQSYDPDHPAQLVKTVDAIHGAVLIVGHSNTVPDLVARFGGNRPITLSDRDYGTVFIVTRPNGNVAELKVQPAH